MKRQVVVIGLGRVGETVATTLYSRGVEVLAIDPSRERVEAVSDRVTHVVQADAADEATLRELGIAAFDVGLVTIATNIEASVMSTLLLKRLGVRQVIARASSPLHAEILWRIGADRVIFPEREMGIQLAHTLGGPHIEDYLAVTPEYGLSRLRLPAVFAGQTIGGLDLPRRCGLTVVLVQHGQEISVAPSPGQRLEADDQIVVAGTVEALERLNGLIDRAPG